MSERHNQTTRSAVMETAPLRAAILDKRELIKTLEWEIAELEERIAATEAEIENERR